MTNLTNMLVISHLNIVKQVIQTADYRVTLLYITKLCVGILVNQSTQFNQHSTDKLTGRHVSIEYRIVISLINVHKMRFELVVTFYYLTIITTLPREPLILIKSA